MDNTKKLTVVEWFTGYGGNELGLRRCLPNMRPIAFCEREAFVVANLVSKMEKGLLDPVPVWTDAKTFPCEPFKDRVNLFVASYPCQGFSHAGKRLGVEDERHLWPYCRKWIQGARPGAVFLENVEGHVTLGLSTVLADLEEDGYKSAWGIFSASEVGAPHQRKRVFILAYDKNTERELGGDSRLGRSGLADGCDDVAQQQQGLEGHAGDVHRQGGEPGGENRPVAEGGVCGVWPSRPGVSQYGWEPPRTVVGKPAERGERGEQERGVRAGEEADGGREANNHDADGPGAADGREIKSALGRNPNGPSDGLDLPGCTSLSDTELAEIREWMVKGTNRTDELRMCGNGVVPSAVCKAWLTLYRELKGTAEF